RPGRGQHVHPDHRRRLARGRPPARPPARGPRRGGEAGAVGRRASGAPRAHPPRRGRSRRAPAARAPSPRRRRRGRDGRERAGRALAADAEIARLLDGFVGRLPERLGAMERALGARDLVGLADLAHQLKGAATGYGFPTITEAAAELEAVAAARGEVERALAALAD